MTEKAEPTVQIDNERARVTEWRFAPGAATGWHRHEYRACAAGATCAAVVV